MFYCSWAHPHSSVIPETVHTSVSQPNNNTGQLGTGQEATQARNESNSPPLAPPPVLLPSNWHSETCYLWEQRFDPQTTLAQIYLTSFESNQLQWLSPNPIA